MGVILLIGGGWRYQATYLNSVKIHLAGVQAERARLQDVVDKVDQARTRSDLLREKLQLILDLKTQQTGPVLLLDQVNQLLTDGLWLDQMDLEDGNVRLEGAALSEAGVADFVTNLNGSPYFRGVRLRTIVDSDTVIAFNITFQFRPTPVSPEGLAVPASLEAQD